MQCNAMGHTLHLVLKAVLLVSQFILHANACASHRLNFMKIYWIHLLNIVAWNILIQGRKGDIILIRIVSSSLKIELNCIVLDNRQWWSIFRVSCALAAHWNSCQTQWMRLTRVEIVINYKCSMHFDIARFRFHLPADKQASQHTQDINSDSMFRCEYYGQFEQQNHLTQCHFGKANRFSVFEFTPKFIWWTF